MFWCWFLAWVQSPSPELWDLWKTRFSKGWEPARQSPQLKLWVVPTHRFYRRPEDFADVERQRLVGRLLEISQQGTTDLALLKFSDVQADDAVNVDVVTELREHLEELDVLGVRLRVEHQ